MQTIKNAILNFTKEHDSIKQSDNESIFSNKNNFFMDSVKEGKQDISVTDRDNSTNNNLISSRLKWKIFQNKCISNLRYDYNIIT